MEAKRAQVTGWASEVIAIMGEVGTDFAAILAPPFSMSELYDLLTDLVQATEVVVRGPGQGADKFTVVEEVLDELDDVYHWRAALAAAMHLPGWLGSRIIGALDSVVIGLIVRMLNRFGVWTLIVPYQEALAKLTPPLPEAADDDRAARLAGLAKLKADQAANAEKAV